MSDIYIYVCICLHKILLTYSSGRLGGGDLGTTLDPGLLARSQYPEGPAIGHLETGFSWFPCA